MDLDARTLRALDWDFVLEHLSRHAATLRGVAAARRPDFAGDRPEALRRFQAVEEVWAVEAQGDAVPVGAILDVAPLADRASRGEVLSLSDLFEVAGTLRALDRLKGWLLDRAEVAPALVALVAPLEVDAELRALLDRSLDDAGDLREAAFPQIAVLRGKIERSRAAILRILEGLLNSSALADALQDRFITERDGRFVLPIKASHRKGLGILHGRSQSGETCFIEPGPVVEPTNDLREAEAELAAEVQRILAALSRRVGQAAAGLGPCLDAATAVDLAVARARFGQAIDGVVPRVGDAGVIQVSRARHPVLVLRGVPVIANDLVLDSRQPALVLTGPNTGGKTVALKTLGMAALFARAGLPCPVGRDSRVDFFDAVLADIGDMQAIEQDLSTFSGHVRVLVNVLERAGPGVLVLLDEIAAGTDPAQGAALARAVLEAVADAGARVVATTHYGELKALGHADPRFGVAAVLYADGRPTYRVAPGVAGDSHALSVAARLGLPAAVLARARALQSDGARALSELLEALEEERSRSVAQNEALEAAQREAAARSAALDAREAALELRARELKRRMADETLARLRAQEREVKAMVAALQQDPSSRAASEVLGAIRALKEEVAVPPPPAPPPPPALAVGDLVRVHTMGAKGKIIAVHGDDRLEVEAGRLRLKVRRSEVEVLGQGRGGRPARPVAPRPPPVVVAAEPAPTVNLGSLRLPSNTVDLRGQRVEEALERIDAFLDTLMSRREEVGWILHGHGTGALKTAVRQWLPDHRLVRRWRPADVDEGGDAFTVVELIAG